MSFTITPKGDSPASSTPSQPSPKLSPKERAMRILMQGSQNGAQPPIQPGQKISPEEAGAVLPPSAAEPSATPETENHGSVDSDSPPPEATQASEPPKAKEEPLSAQYAQLARKEKALRAEMQRLKSEREAFKREQEALQTPAKPAASSFDPAQYVSKDQLKDPAAVLQVLSEMGLTYDQLTEAQLNAPSPGELKLQQTISKLEAKLAELDEKTAKTQKTFEERDRQAYQDALNQIQVETKSLVEADPNFEMIKATNSVKDVVDLIKDTWDKEKRLISVEEACQAVEDYLVEESLKLYKVGKIQKRLQPAASQPPTAPAAKSAATAAPQQQQPKTLSNAVATGTPKMSRTERALAAFRGEKIS